MRIAKELELDVKNECVLNRISKSNTVSVREARRATIVLLAARGKTNHEIANELGIGRIQVARWRERYLAGGLAALVRDRPRGGRPTHIDAQEIVRLTTQTKPKGATHWSTRSLAAHTGVGATSIRRIWNAHGLKPIGYLGN